MTDEDEFESPIHAQLAAPVTDDLGLAAGQSAPQTNPATGANPLLHSRWAVLAMLFLVTGALGVPLLWMNPNFSKTERIFWAIIVSIYTALLIFTAGAIVMWSFRQIFG